MAHVLPTVGTSFPSSHDLTLAGFPVYLSSMQTEQAFVHWVLQVF